ncbi:MAG: ABC transporter permease [Planctomycetota bacterium]|nr:ABC transporter permease [Planctomycetota bacterium]
MTRLIFFRLLQAPLIVFAIMTIAFTLSWVVPGNPLEDEGRAPPPEVQAAMLKQYDLDDPLVFYGQYLARASGVAWIAGRSPAPFDLGPSLRHPDWTVNEIIASGFPISASLGLLAIEIALVIGVVVGVAGALKPRGILDLLGQLVTIVGISVPSFVTGALLLVLFAAKWHLFPMGGWGSWKDIVLPAFALSLPFAAYIARLVRFGLIEQMASDHIRTARAKGLSRNQSAYRHALKNAFLPVLSYLGPAIAAAMTGSFVVEKVFAVPGMGRHFVNAVLSKDITLILGIVLVYSSILVLMNLIVDILYAAIDPRIQLEG